MITTTPEYQAANAVPSRTPQYAVEFASSVNRAFSTHPILVPVTSPPTFAYDYMQLPQTTNPSQIYPDRGQSSIGSVQFDVEDVNGIVTALLAASPFPLTYGIVATLKQGFATIPYSDFTPVFLGIVTNCVVGSAAGGASLTSYTITIQDPSTFTNKQIFNPRSTTLAAAMDNSQSTMDVWDTDDFLTVTSPATARYLIVDNEIMSYTGITVDGNLPKTQSNLNKVAYGNGVFVAVGDKGVIFYSSDGKNWTEGGSQTSFDLHDIAFGNGIFVTVGDNGVIMSSVDGNVWVFRVGQTVSSLRAVVWAAGTIHQWIIVANNEIQVSSNNAASWDLRTSPSADAWQCLAYSPTLDMVVAGSGSSRNFMTSVNGFTWVHQNGGTLTPGQPITRTTSIAWAAFTTPFTPTFIAVTDEENFQASADGITWNISDRAISGFNIFATSVTFDPVLKMAIVVGPPDGIVGTNIFAYNDGSGWHLTTGTGFWSGVTTNLLGTIVAVSHTNGGLFLQLAMSSTSNPPSFARFIQKFTGLTRGVLRSAAAAHDAGVGVDEMIRIQGHPIDIALGVLTNTDKTGVGMPATLLNTAEITALKPNIGYGALLDFRLRKSWNGKDFLEQQIYQIFALFPATSNGKYSIKQIVLGPSLMSVDHDNVLEGTDEPPIGIDQNWSASIINYVEIQSDYEIFNDKFYTKVPYKEPVSIGKFGRMTIPPLQSYGIRSELGSAEVAKAMRNLFSVYGQGAALFYADLFLATNLLENGDTIDVTSTLLPNLTTGKRGILAALMLVINRAVLWDQGHVSIQALSPLGKFGDSASPNPEEPPVSDCNPGVADLAPTSGKTNMITCVYQDADRVYIGVTQRNLASPYTYQNAKVYVVKKSAPTLIEQIIDCGANADQVRWVSSDTSYIYALVDDPFTGTGGLRLKRFLRSNTTTVTSLLIINGSDNNAYYRNSHNVIYGNYIYVAWSNNQTSDGRLSIARVDLTSFTVLDTLTTNPLSATGTFRSYGLAVDGAAGLIYAVGTKSDATEKFDVIVFFINIGSFAVASHINRTVEASPSTSMGNGSCSAPVFNSAWIYVGYHVAGPSADQGVIRIEKSSRSVAQDVRPAPTIPGQVWFGMDCDEDWLYSLGSDKAMYRQQFNNLSVINQGQILQSNPSLTPEFVLKG